MHSAIDQRRALDGEAVGWRRYESGDIYRIRARAADDFERDAFEEAGEAWTLWADEVLVVFGFAPIDAGVAMFWGVVSDAARERGTAYIRQQVRFVRDRIAAQPYRRLQTTIRCDREYQRFIELLGFEKEGLMRKLAADGSDLWLYSKV